MEWKLAEIQDSKKNIIKIPERWVYLKYYEAFNLLFRIENALRVFVYTILKNEFKEKWSEISIVLEDSGNSTISSIAKKRMAQAKSFGYLGHSIVSPIMYLTSGELTRLIVDDSYWKLFTKHFKGNRDIIKNKMEEIAAIRNSLAHFRPIKDDDLTAIKHNAKHVLMGVEEFLLQVLNQRDVVPTNTEDPWYKQLKILKNELCAFSFYQSSDSEWIRIILTYKCPILKTNQWVPTYINYSVLTLDSSAVLGMYSTLTNTITFLSESIPYVSMPEDRTPIFTKSLHFVFARKAFLNIEDKLQSEFSLLIQKLLEESMLIQQDNLARGTLVYSVSSNAKGTQKEKNVEWHIDREKFRTPVAPDDPSEYWGNFLGYSTDFVAETNEYPWMPEDISEWESSF